MPQSKPAPSLDLWMPTAGELTNGVEIPVVLDEDQSPIVLHLHSLRDLRVVRKWMAAMSPGSLDTEDGAAMNQARTICELLLKKISGFQVGGELVEIEADEENNPRICSFLLRTPAAVNAVNDYITETLGIGQKQAGAPGAEPESEEQAMVGKPSSGSRPKSSSPTMKSARSTKNSSKTVALGSSMSRKSRSKNVTSRTS